MSEERITVGSFWIQTQEGNFEAVRLSDFNTVANKCNSLFEELAALREELAEAYDRNAEQRVELDDLHELKNYATTPLRERCAERKDLQQRLTAAEQRNAELVEWCAKKCEERAAYYEAGDDDAPGSRRAGACQNCADVIRWNKPTESGASE